uniref:NPH3 domain-containing protein n=1 Tax=Kalanchoe fedtschenkoi TaxID=63787 RepID=A0A7N0UX05_KALFE
MPDPPSLQAAVMEPGPEDACIRDMDNFVQALTGFRSKGVQPELIGSIIAHYASKWLPDLSHSQNKSSETSATSSWMKKRFFIQTLVDFLPQEQATIPCNFLLKLLKAANMVGVEPAYRTQIEKRVALELDQATIKELMIPSFSHTCATLLDVDLVHRLARIFVELDESAKSGSALAKVAKLVDSYLAEAATDAKLTLTQFINLASVLPDHARSSHDGLYRAIDTYLKAHPGVAKQERRTLCNIIDSQKLSQEASFHAAQNERLPVRSVIQVLFSEQTKMSRQLEWSGSFSGTRSPMPVAVEPAARCHSKRVAMSPQQVEMKRLKEEVAKLQTQCNLLQEQVEKIMNEKKKGIFKWKKFSLIPSMKTMSEKAGDGGHRKGEVVLGRETPMVDVRTNLIRGRTPPRWRKSLS